MSTETHPPGAAAALDVAPVVSVTVTRDPALVRTVRLVAAAVTRRVTSDEDFVEVVRLAVGEGCALMVGADQSSEEPVTVTLTVTDRLTVAVSSAGAIVTENAHGHALGDAGAAPGDAGGSHEVADDADLPAPVDQSDTMEPWALLRGLVDTFEADLGDGSATLRMSWPLR